MKRKKLNLAALALSALALAVPSTSMGFDRHRSSGAKDQWKTLATISGIAGLIGVANHDKTLAAIGLAGALYAGYRYETDNRGDCWRYDSRGRRSRWNGRSWDAWTVNGRDDRRWNDRDRDDRQWNDRQWNDRRSNDRDCDDSQWNDRDRNGRRWNDRNRDDRRWDDRDRDDRRGNDRDRDDRRHRRN